MADTHTASDPATGTGGDPAGGRAATTTTNAYLRRDRRDRMVYRLRRQLAPHLLLAGVWVTGAAGWLAGGWAGDRGLVATGLVAALAAAGAVRWLTTRRRGAAVTGRQAAGVAAATGWLGWATMAGPGWTATAVLLAGGYAASLRWWRRWRLPDPGEDPQPPAGPDPMHPPRLWADHIAQGGPLPGSYLTGEHQIATGLRYQAHLVPGRQSLGEAQAALAKLRTGLRLRPGQDLILERHPDTDESIISVTIVRRSRALTAAVPWPGPAYDRQAGTIELGPYVDGEGTARWRLAVDHRLFGGFLVGSTGSGKSRLMEAIALGAADGAGCVVWFGDPQGGASSPFLARRADWTARSVEDIGQMLAAAVGVKRLRQAENALHDWEGWTPDQGRPGLLIIIDECHEAMADAAVQQMATSLAREGGKVGIALVLASQVPTLDAFGLKTGQRALRGSVVTGNLVLLRVADKGTSGILPGVSGIDPADFPAIAGYAYLVDIGHTGRRSAPFRGYYVTDDARDAAADQANWPTLDSAAAGAAGPAYNDRYEQAEAARAALAGRLAALARGEDPDTAPPPAAARPVAVPWPVAQVIPYPRWRTWHLRDAAPAEVAERSIPPRRTAVEVVAELVDAGVTGTGEIERRSGYSETQVRNALHQLAGAGRIRRVRHGVWELAT
jgi:hypothetical protein